MTTRKPCVNVPTATFSGKEQSPLHFGLSAEGYDLNTILEGYDRMMWSVKMKNGRKVWIRNMPIGGNIQRMVHEEPVIVKQEGAVDAPNVADTAIENAEIVREEPTVSPPKEPTKPPVMKAVVEEKKVTDYNIFLAYRLYELKKAKPADKTNKELFNQAVAEWKELKKNAVELKKTMGLAKEFANKNSV